MNQKERTKAKEEALAYLQRAHIVITRQEADNMEIVDFGLGHIRETGLQLIVYVNTQRVCAKELVLLPNQTCPEHRHPDEGPVLGKEETFRCRYGEVYLYLQGKETPNRKCSPPKGDEHYYSVFHEIHLLPGDQYTLMSDTLHWFQAGPQGAVISEFSTRSTDEKDIFTDPRIRRV